jgi:hypothetical protein
MRFARVPAGIANQSIAPNTAASRHPTMPAAMFQLRCCGECRRPAPQVHGVEDDYRDKES